MALVGGDLGPIDGDAGRPGSGGWHGDGADHEAFILREHERVLAIADLGLPENGAGGDDLAV